MTLTRHEKKRLALTFLELRDRFANAPALNPERSGGDGTAPRAESDMYIAMISFKNNFTWTQWRALEILYRPDLKKDDSQARRLGIAIGPAWRKVARRSDYYLSVAVRHSRLMR